MGFVPQSETAERDDELELLFYTAAQGDRRLTIDFYFSLGASDAAHSVTLNGEGLDTCATCVIARTGCGSLLCSTSFMAQSGILEITEMGDAGESFTGSFDEIVFAEVEVESGSQETTLVAGGQSWCIRDYAFEIPVSAP